MENVKEIMSDYCLKRARNSEHYEANKELIAAITTEFTDAFGISHLRKTWVDLFMREEESYNTNAAILPQSNCYLHKLARESLRYNLRAKSDPLR